MHDFCQGWDSSASMAKVLVKTQHRDKVEGGKNRGQARKRDIRKEAGMASLPPVFHSLWVKFSGNTPLVEFSLFCCQSSCLIPISQPSSWRHTHENQYSPHCDTTIQNLYVFSKNMRHYTVNKLPRNFFAWSTFQKACSETYSSGYHPSVMSQRVMISLPGYWQHRKPGVCCYLWDHCLVYIYLKHKNKHFCRRL